MSQLWKRGKSQPMSSEEEEEWGFDYLRLDQLDPHPVKQRIDGLLTERGHVLLSAYRKTGKTTLVMHLAAALTSKHKQFLGKDCTPLRGRLIYVNLELEQNMLRDYAGKQGIDLARDNILVLDKRGRSSTFHLGDEEWREQWAKSLRKEDAEALIVDPIHVLSVSSGVDSNNNDEARGVLEALGEVATMAKLTHLFIVDHTGHADKSRARGASGKEDWADVLWNLKRDEGQEQATLVASGRGVSGGATYSIGEDGLLYPGEAAGGDNSNNRIMLTLGKSARPMTIAELGAATGLSQQSVSRVCLDLEEQGSARRIGKVGRADAWLTTRSV